MDTKRKNFLLKICLPLILAAVLITGVACFFCLKKPKPLNITAQDFVISQGETKLLDGSVFSVSQPYAVVTFEIEDEQILQKDGFSVKGIGVGECQIVFVATWQNISTSCICTATVTKPKDTTSENSPSGSEQYKPHEQDGGNNTPDETNPNAPDDNQPNTPDENQGEKDDGNQSQGNTNENKPTNPDENEPTNPEENQPTNPDDNKPTNPDENKPSTPDENQPTNPQEQQKPQSFELVIDNTINCVYEQQTKTLTVPQGEKAGFTILVENSAQTNFENLLQNCTKSAWIDLWLENGIFFIQAVAPGCITFSVNDQQFEIFVELQPRTEIPDNPSNEQNNSNETQNPDNSENPNENENTDKPQNENNPQNPEQPTQPDTPIQPETNPNKPEIPDEPEDPKNPEECDFYIYNAIGCEFDETTKVLKVPSGASVQFCLGTSALAVVRPSALLENCTTTEGVQLFTKTYSLVGEMFCLTATKSGCIIFKISETQQITLYVEIVN